MANYIKRAISEKILEARQFYPVIAITGPRQSGKTSLCRHLFDDYKYVNLEDLTTRAIAADDPTKFLDSHGDKLIIDEVQNIPELLSMIQVRVDEDRSRRYVLTGSCNFTLMHTMSQSLAGRVALFTLLPFSFPELGDSISGSTLESLMFQGQYPGVTVNGIPPQSFYSNYYRTYVERDVRDLLKLKNLIKFDTFVRLLASRAGSEFNASALATETGVSSTTISEWLSILATSYIVYTLRPYHANISKRLTKMPKVYFYDTGLLCYLLGIEGTENLENHILRGAIFENLAISELIKRRLNDAREPNITFYREHSGKEVDAIISTASGLQLYEMKAGRTYKQDFSKNMKYLENLLPDVAQSTVIYDGVSMPPTAINIREI